MPRSTAIQSERTRRRSPRASTSPASFNRHSPDSRPVGPDFPSLDVPPQRNSIAIDLIGSQTAGLLAPDLRICRVSVIEAVTRRSGWENSDNQDGNPASRHWHDRRGVSVAQEAIEDLIVAARRSGVGGDCRVDRRAAAASLAFEGGAAAVAFDVHLEDGGVMDEAVDDSDRHCLVAEHGAIP